MMNFGPINKGDGHKTQIQVSHLKIYETRVPILDPRKICKEIQLKGADQSKMSVVQNPTNPVALRCRSPRMSQKSSVTTQNQLIVLVNLTNSNLGT